jgi:hypothetical protein
MRGDPLPTPGGPDERTLAWLLAVVLAVAFGLRMWMALTLPSYFDDRYVFNNIETFLNGSLRPRHSYYGSLSYLPQALVLKVCDLLHSRTGIEALAVRGGPFQGFTRGAFLITRTFVVFYALASILMIYLAGRRLFTPGVGLTAAAVLAAYPQHVRSAVQLKPDMMALTFTLLTLYWTAEAVRSPRLASFLRSGVGVGLTTAAKYIGVGSALPLTVWALGAGRRDRRLWGWLVLAGASSVVTFLALNPFFGTVLHFGTRLVGFYGKRARVERSGHLLVLRQELDFLIVQHGWVLGACLLLGTALLIHRLRSNREAGGAAAVLLLSLSIGYPVAYALGMTLFRTHNALPALGGTALVCACGMVRSGQWLLSRPAAARSPAAVALAGCLPGLFLLARPLAYTYRQLIPDTWTVAAGALRTELAPPEIRHVAYEPEGSRLRLAQGWQSPALTAVPSLAALPPALLDLTDAEVFPLSRARGPQAAFYRARRRSLARECALEIRARLFRSQGPSLLLLLHPWTPAGAAIPVDLRRAGGAPGILTARLPDGLLAAGDVLSAELLRPVADEPPEQELRVGGQSLPLTFAGGRVQKLRFLTPRFRYAGGSSEILVPASPRAHPRNFRLQLWRWTRIACRNQGRPLDLTPPPFSPYPASPQLPARRDV